MDGYLGEIKLWAGSYAPKNWMYCAGQSLAIMQYQALYAVIGLNYGGDGRTTFQLPDFRSRIPVCAGSGPGLMSYIIGEFGGQEFTILREDQLAEHVHDNRIKGPSSDIPVAININAKNGTGNTDNAEGNFWATGTVKKGMTAVGDIKGGYSSTSDVAMDSSAVEATIPGESVTNTIHNSPTGGSSPIYIMQPYLVCNYIICVNGLYPSRN
jgi:microcystin-dependent protein